MSAAVDPKSAWPCGYCRVDSAAALGDVCPCCRRDKALPWWRMSVSLSSCPAAPLSESAVGEVGEEGAVVYANGSNPRLVVV